MRRAIPFLLLFVAALAEAQVTDLAVSVALSPAAPMAGERVQVTLRVRNEGPVAPSFAEAVFGSNEPFIVFPASGNCLQSLRVGDIRCNATGLAPGAEKVFTLSVLAPNRTDVPWQTRASVFAGDFPDLDNSDNLVTLTVDLRPAPGADIKSSLTGPTLVQSNTTVRVTYQVTNSASIATGSVYVYFNVFNFGQLIGVPASGEGWTCSEIVAAQAICSRASLAAGETSTILVDVPAPQRSEILRVVAQTFVEGIEDPVPADNVAQHEFEVATTLNWEPILIPITRQTTPGAFGTQWKTETWMMVESDNLLEIQPRTCTGACPPTRIPFDPYPLGIVQPAPQFEGQLVYVPEGAAGRLRVQTRIHDETRNAESFGIEVPAIRASQLAANANVVLMNVPVTPEFRHTLRIYDPSANPNRLVGIFVYAMGEQNYRFFLHRRFEVPANDIGGPRGLPLRPGYIQFSSNELGDLAGVERIYYRVSPSDFDARLWAFVSVTNNATQEVTVITP